MLYKIKVTSAVIMGFALILFVICLFIKIDHYKQGIEGIGPIHGTYRVSNDDLTESVYMAIDEYSNRYVHSDSSGQVIQSGKFEKGDSYVFYEDNSEIVYGKIIKSYNKIYFIDSNLNIVPYDYFMDILILPITTTEP